MLVFLFTDIEGSTRLWEEHTGAMGPVIARHDAILQQQVEAHGGRITKHTGDGVTAAFEDGEPVACALEIQKRFAKESWGEIGDLTIRVGLHAGEAEWIPGAEPLAGDYHGPPVNCTARVMSAAWGGQVLLTPEVTNASGLPPGASLLDLGEHLLKNVAAPQRILQLIHPDLRRQAFPPPRTLSGESIRRTVEGRGSYIAGLPPPAIAVSLTSATLVPMLLGDLSPDSPVLAGNLGVLDDLGAVALRAFMVEFAARLQASQQAGQAIDLSEVREWLEGELLERWQGRDETALALRAGASQLLQAVQGVQAAMTAATGDVRLALAQGLADLGGQFGEFRWMLAGVQDTLAEMRARQELQLSLQRQQLAKTEEILELQREQVRGPLAVTVPQAAEPPAFLEGEGEPFQQPVFVARERELAWLDAFLQTALTGQGRVILVGGGPGRGKTALLNEFARRAMAANPDLLVASGGCNAFSGVGDPYLPFREVMGMLGGDVEARWLAGQITRPHAQRLWAALPQLVQALLARGPDVLGVFVQPESLLARAATVAGEDAPWLGALREAVGRRQALPPGAATQGAEQGQLFEQYTNVLRRVSRSHPLLLILDDLQWADAASIGLLFHLGRRLQGLPILIACAYRPEEVALGRNGERHPLEKVLAEFRRLYGDVCLDLGREDKVESRGFIDALLDTEPNQLGERFRAAFLDHTGGHPLFAIELLRDLQERGDLVRNERAAWVEGPALSWQLLPARVEGVIEERIGRLEEDLRDALTVASVEGEEFTAQVVARVQEVQERHLLRRLSQELEKRHRLVRERGEERVGRRLLSRYRFAHALFQQYLYNDLSAGERRLLHGEVARVLAELFEEAVEEIAVQLAFHYRRAGMEEQALPHLIRAGHQARAKFANDEAVGYYSEALRTVPGDGPERFDLLSCRAAVYDLIARRDEQRADVDEMLDLAEELGDDARLCDALLALADYYWETRHLDAQEPGEKALALARSLGDPEREGQALQRLGFLHRDKGDYHRSREALEAAVRLFMDAGLPGEAASCLHMLSLPLKALQEFGPAMEAAKRSVALSQAAGDRRQEAIALRRLAITHDLLRAAEALPYVQRALALHREVGDRCEETNALNALGLTLAHRGEHEESESCFRQSLAIAESIGASIQISYAVLNLVQYHHLRRGDFEDSLQFLDTRLDHALAVGDDWLVATLGVARGYVLMRLGQYDRASRSLATASQTMEELGDPGSALSARLWSGLVNAYLGDYEGSALNLQMAVERARERRNEGLLAWALVCQGFAGLLEGRPQTLSAGLERVLEGLDLTLDERFFEKHFCYETAAALHLALGETELALECSTEGLRMMESDPARLWAEHRHFTHSRILRALGREAEADEHLKRAYERVMLVAGQTQDQDLKKSWLENVEVNREILAACAQRGIGRK